jgi:hypothetical protein
MICVESRDELLLIDRLLTSHYVQFGTSTHAKPVDGMRFRGIPPRNTGHARQVTRCRRTPIQGEHMSPLLSSHEMLGLPLKNRVVMAPMTRCRAKLFGMPNPLMAEYYEQRASAGLIITEATNVSGMSASFELAPGIFTDEQMEAWRSVVARVHAAGGKICMQLWHGGRVSSFALLDDRSPLSPSGVNGDL